jgi:5-methyltetrahydrofolate--homocysteine methyltransferase
MFTELSLAVKSGNAPKVKELTDGFIAKGVEPEDILNQGLISGMMEIGVLFKNNQVYVPEVLIAARAMYAGLDIIKPLLAQKDFKAKGKVAIGTVKGDLHDIGKNLVAMMMEGSGLEVIDLGTDVGPDKYIAAVKESGAQIIAMSALLTTTMPEMKNIIDALSAAGLRDEVKVMIGGAPVTAAYAEQIGADFYTDDAASAATAAIEALA